MKATNSITNNQKKFLRGIAHGLSPMIIIGSQGITDNLMAELKKHSNIMKS